MTCPAAEQLRRFLDDELSGDEESALVSHVAVCAECQRRMDQMTSCEVPCVSPLTATEPGLRALIDQLRERPFEAWSAMTELSIEEGSVRFAGPVSELAPLGWLGAYQIEQELGVGTTGQVFAARDSRLGRRAAIKVLRPQWASHPTARSRFEREARAVAALEDERIVKVFEVGETPEHCPFIVMEFVDGDSLDARLKRDRMLSPRDAAAIARQIALGLNVAHRHGIVHRDVKPSNILLVAARGTANLPAIKLADFGLARVAEATESLTQEGFIAGTPAYMSPEQIRRPQDSDARSDVYSVGVLLYEMLTGERPFRGVVRMVLHQALHEEPVPPRRLNDRIPRDLETICLKGMSKEPSRRYDSAADLAEDLRRWLDSEPVHARPVGVIGRAWRWCRRNPKLAILNAIVVALLLAGAVDATRYLRPSESWRYEADAARQEAARWRTASAQHRSELLRLIEATVFQVNESDAHNALTAAVRSLDAIHTDEPTDSLSQVLAAAHSRLGELSASRGQLADAKRHLQDAIALLRKLEMRRTSHREWSLEVARLLVRQADLARQLGDDSEIDAVIVDCRRQLDSVEQLGLEPSGLYDVAQSRGQFAEVLLRLGRLDESREQARLECETLGRIASKPRATVEQLRAALAATGRRANELLERQEYETAHKALKPATTWAEQLCESTEITFADGQAAALLFRNLAVVELHLDRRNESDQCLGRFEEILNDLKLRAEPAEQSDNREWLASQLRELAGLRKAVSGNR